jgi:hypothetical protein
VAFAHEDQQPVGADVPGMQMTGGAWPLNEAEVDLAPGEHFDNVGTVAHF